MTKKTTEPEVANGKPAIPSDGELTPPEIVAALDRHIIGQDRAKRSVAIALRNRWRRQHVDGAIRDEIIPNNIIMIGPTGVGKTEIARRLADLANAPFIKVEASKFTEVGYVGRDVESIIRDLADLSVNMVKDEHARAVEQQAMAEAEERLLTLLGAGIPEPAPPSNGDEGARNAAEEDTERARMSREQVKRHLRDGALEDETVEIEVSKDRSPVVEVFSPVGSMEEMSINIQEIVSGLTQPAGQRKNKTVSEARRMLVHEETQKLIDMDRAVTQAITRVEQSGIVFLDEVDKIAGEHAKTGPDISREGVQRDLLPIIEGSTVSTKYGMVHTDHILFIAAGAFHASKPSDLIPELQGRFPIRVELDSLGVDEFVQILTRPRSALLKQYEAMLDSEGISLSFTPEAVREIARIANDVNQNAENIGARRLHTVVSTLLDDILFDAPALDNKAVRITKKYVTEKIQGILEDEDLSRYVL